MAADGLLEGLLADLRAEGQAWDDVVAGLHEAGWARPTPAVGWNAGYQVGHLAWTDDVTVRAATDPDAFRALPDTDGTVDAGAVAGGAASPAELLVRWRTSRAALGTALAGPPGAGSEAHLRDGTNPREERTTS